jgi:hypothetical protein
MHICPIEISFVLGMGWVAFECGWLTIKDFINDLRHKKVHIFTNSEKSN